MSDSGKLDGWKQIATHLDVSEKTARLYKNQFDLPVRKLGGRYFAYAHELDQWRDEGGRSDARISEESQDGSDESGIGVEEACPDGEGVLPEAIEPGVIGDTEDSSREARDGAAVEVQDGADEQQD